MGTLVLMVLEDLYSFLISQTSGSYRNTEKYGDQFCKKKIIGVQTWKKTPTCLNGPCVVVIMRVNCLVPNVRNPQTRNEH